MIGYEFPDAAAGVVEVINGLAVEGALAVLWLESAPTGDPVVVHVETLDGSEMGPLRWDDVQVSVYGADRSATRDVAEDCRRLLLAGPHVTEAGVLDSVEIRRTPRQLPYVSASVALFQLIVRVHTRPR